MRRLALIAAVLVAAVAVAITGTGASDAPSYEVRAIFDNAVSVIPGEDVKIAGVKVGKIAELDVTPEKKAAIVLDITERGFQDFRRDATCTIRPQSLIGEKFVECVPTQPRAVGAPPAPRLERIASGEGKGQHLLPLSQTSSPVDIDLINNIMRRPYAERLSIILGELGTGVAARGRDLDLTIRRANPALRETDRVLKILASQNRVLADLASDSDIVLAPLARERRAVADQFAQSAVVARATAQRGDDLEADLRLLPEFLRQLRPTMVRLGALADEATPVFADLRAQAGNVNRLVRELGPFSSASIPALRTLGEAAEIGGPALANSRPTIQELRRFARAARPLSRNAALLLDSFQKAGGVERLLDYIFYQVAAINGFDQFGHYLRAALIVNLCTTYSVQPAPGCSANFEDSASASSRLSAGQVARLRANAARLAGDAPGLRPTRSTVGAARPIAMPRIALPGRLGDVLSPPARRPGDEPADGGPQPPTSPTAPPPTTPAPPPDPAQGLLDYLLGSGS